MGHDGISLKNRRRDGRWTDHFQRCKEPFAMGGASFSRTNIVRTADRAGAGGRCHFSLWRGAFAPLRDGLLRYVELFFIRKAGFV